MLIIDHVSLFSLIAEKEMTINDVAEKAGVAATTIINYLNRDVEKPNTVTIGKLAKALNVEPRCFVRFIEEESAYHKFMFMLSQRKQDILKMRKAGYTLEEIGKKYGVTKERVRQLESKALYELNWYEKNQYDEKVRDLFNAKRLENEVKQ